MIPLFKKILLFVLLIFQISFLQAEQADSEQVFDINNYQGKVVYLDFWASWCIPCRKSFPWMNELRKKYSPEQLVIVAVNLDKKRELAEAFLEEYPASFEIIYDPKGKLAKRFQIKGMPSSIVFDQNGQAVSAHTGFFLEKITQYDEEIKKLILSLEK